MIKIDITKYLEFKTQVIGKSLKHFNYKKDGRLFLVAIDGPLYFIHRLAAINLKDYENTFAATANIKVGDEVVISPFASKGKNHFRGKGTRTNCLKNTVTNVDFHIPPSSTNGMATFRYNGIELLNGAFGDDVDLLIIDSAAGTFSGYPSDPPIVPLDQFGDNWNVKPDMVKILPYEATLYTSMIIRVAYKNNGNEDRLIGVNHDLHLVL